MKLQQKMEMLGFNSEMLGFLEEQGPSALEVLALIWPEQAYYFYQHYFVGREISDLAQSAGKAPKTIQRALHGWSHVRGEELGAEDWFLVILQIFFEADHLLTAGDTVSCCFTRAVTGSRAPLGVPFHRAFLRIMCAAMTPHDPAESLPWTKSSERADAMPFPFRHVLWPAFCAPLAYDMLPGLLAVLRDADPAERPWLCVLSLLLAEKETLWGNLLRLLNPPAATCADRRRLTTPSGTDKTKHGQAKDLLDSLTDKFERHAVLALLTKTPCHWADLVDKDLANLEHEDRVVTCAKMALANLRR